MLRRVASLPLVPLVAACAQTPMNVSGSTVVLGPGHVLVAQVTPTAGADLRIRLEGHGPGDATFELALATGEVFAEGTLRLSDLERSYSAGEIPLRLSIQGDSSDEVAVEWKLASAMPLEVTWGPSAARDG